MVKKDKEKVMLAEHILEVRHKASGSFLDVRGNVADYIHDRGLFPHWKIDTNVVNFRDLPDKVKLEGAFIGYKNAGYFVYNPETRNYFVDRAGAFWRSLLENEIYKIPPVTRFGARTKVFLPSKKSFNKINKAIYETFFTENIRSVVGGKENDVQFIIELTESKFEVRLSGGPVREGEVNKYLSFESDHFSKCGLFLDLDYYKTQDINHDSIPTLIKEGINLTWEKVERLATALGL